nr:putative integron gene cassette protein [uncultured bacterium]
MIFTMPFKRTILLTVILASLLLIAAAAYLFAIHNNNPDYRELCKSVKPYSTEDEIIKVMGPPCKIDIEVIQSQDWRCLKYYNLGDPAIVFYINPLTDKCSGLGIDTFPDG